MKNEVNNDDNNIIQDTKIITKKLLSEDIDEI